MLTPYVCEHLRKFKPTLIMREDVVVLMGGEHVAAKLGHLATYFGVVLSTVKGWRQVGMPGRPGSYNVADVFLWRIQRDAEGERRPLTIYSCPCCEARRAEQR